MFTDKLYVNVSFILIYLILIPSVGHSSGRVNGLAVHPSKFECVTVGGDQTLRWVVAVELLCVYEYIK